VPFKERRLGFVDSPRISTGAFYGRQAAGQLHSDSTFPSLLAERHFSLWNPNGVL